MAGKRRETDRASAEGDGVPPRSDDESTQSPGGIGPSETELTEPQKSAEEAVAEAIEHGDDVTKPRRGTAKAAPGTPVAFPIVGIGASAGGVEAVSDFLEALPPDTGMALVLIQHLSPSHPSILPEILSRKTSMPVHLATNEIEVRPDNVYVIPPGVDMTIFHGRLNLMERTSVRGSHLPIDYFMRSLAQDQGRRAIGVILSGTSSDGTLGMVAIKAEGGITFAQDPSTAKYDGMPNSAILGGAVDIVLDSAGIGRELCKLGKHPYVSEPETEPAVVPLAEERDQSFLTKIFVMLRSVFGVDFSTYRSTTVLRRIHRRMALYRMNSLQEYVDYLREHPDELTDLYHDILIMVTEFFREPESYEALLSSVLPKIIDSKKNDDQIRVWVPGCATGEEPYSLAMTLVKAMRTAGRELPVKIFATDISERDIEAARGGVFPENKLQQVPAEYRRFFSRSDGAFLISKSIRDMCIFARHDVTADPPFSQLDLVSCRNLLIYLGPATQERVIPVFHYALHQNGYLVLGSAESIGGATDLFETVDKKNKFFIKRPVPHRLPMSFGYPHVRQGDGGQEGAKHAGRAADGRPDLRSSVEQVLLAEIASPSVLVDERFDIVYFHGGTEPFLKHASGKATLNLLEMAREGLVRDIRKVVDDSRKKNDKSVRTARFTQGGAIREVELRAFPIERPNARTYTLVVLQELDRGSVPGETPNSDRATVAQAEMLALGRREVADLQRELDGTREYMQSLIQDKEAALEELRAANEEIQSSNEELQSINEELETAKEELQSTNEELRTVNEELEHRNTQLSRINDDLNNLLRAVDVPTIMIDRDLTIRRFTPGTERIMNLIPTDVGRPITDIAPRLQLTNLTDLLVEAVENTVEREREVRDEQGRWYSMRIRPYQTEENRIEGAVITLTNIDQLRRADAELAEARRYEETLRAMLAHIREIGLQEELLPWLLGQAVKAVEADAAMILENCGDGWKVTHGHGMPHRGGLATVEAAQIDTLFRAMSRGPLVLEDLGSLENAAPDLAAKLSARALIGAPVDGGRRHPSMLWLLWQGSELESSGRRTDFIDAFAALLALIKEG